MKIVSQAQLRTLRIAPRKVRVVADAIKGHDVTTAENQLRYLAKKSAEPILKLMKSAIANARHNAKIGDTEKLIVTDMRVDEGPAYKRFTPRARGRATTIKKRTSHISITLATEN